jgi:hypothetical protein
MSSHEIEHNFYQPRGARLANEGDQAFQIVEHMKPPKSSTA